MRAIMASEGRRGLSLQARGVRVSARQRDGSRLPVLDIDGLTLEAGARVALTGPSGAGKSSLLGALAGIVGLDAGRIAWGDDDIATLPEGARDGWRRRNVGLVFQEFHLVPELDILSNILLPARFARVRGWGGIRDRAASLAAAMGLSDLRRRAAILSRGEQQRTAIARALLHDPAIILADEPTASLDQPNGHAVADLLAGTAARSGATLVVATHDPALIARLDRRWPMAAGRIGTEMPA